MYFTSFLENGKLTIALTGEIDHHCAKAYIQIISSKIEAYMPQVCVLDFHEVTFVDSSGIAVVINALRNMSQILNSRKIIHHFQYSSESSIFLEKRREKCLIFLLTYDIIRLYVN